LQDRDDDTIETQSKTTTGRSLRVWNYASYFPDCDGDAAAIWEYSCNLEQWHDALLEARDSFWAARRSYPEWKGHSQEAFEAQSLEQYRLLDVLEEESAKAVGAVRDYHDALNSRLRVIRSIRADAENLDTIYNSLSWGQVLNGGDAHLEAQFKSLKSYYAEQLAKLEQDRAECAAVLREALRLEPYVKGRSTPLSTKRALTQDELDALAALIEGNDDYPFSLTQGEIGDCYFLSSILALAQSKSGRDRLRSLLTVHRNSDGRVDGFYVTFPAAPGDPNPFGTDAVFVTDVYTQGTSSSAPGLDSLLESAYAQCHTGGVNQWYKGGAQAGLSAQALYTLTGHVTSPSLHSVMTRFEIKSACDAGRPITAETFFASEATVWVDGAEQTITITGSHAYAITGADDQGVYITNPWGKNGIPNSRERTGGQFYMTYDQFKKHFLSYAIGQC